MLAMKRDQNPITFNNNKNNSNPNSSNFAEKIGLSIHAPVEWQKIIPPQELQRLVESGDQVGIHVLIGDIRKSTFLMKESISSKRFALITRDFMKAVKDAASKNEGWFDKFTGDGFIIYWIYGDNRNQQNTFRRSYPSVMHYFLFSQKSWMSIARIVRIFLLTLVYHLGLTLACAL